MLDPSEISVGTLYQRNRILEHLKNRSPLIAMNNPDFHWEERLMLLCGQNPESFRNRCRVAQNEPGNYKNYRLQGRHENTNERRAFDRHLAQNVTAQLVLGDCENRDVTPVDVSYGGIAFEVQREGCMAPGEPLGIVISFGGKDILMVGVIANIRDSGETMVMGMQFNVKVASEKADQLHSLLIHCQEGRYDFRRNSAAA